MKDDLIQKLYADQIELTSEEVAYLARLVHNAEGAPVPYQHEEKDVFVASGFKGGKEECRRLGTKANLLFKKETKGLGTKSRKVEEAEKLLMSDPLVTRLFILGFLKMMAKSKSHEIDI